MITKRIEDIEIDKRGLYTAVYGQISDVFVGEDMKKYSFDQQMYLYLKKRGYDYVVFFDQHHSFYSFRKDELETFVRIKTEKKQVEKLSVPVRISNLKGPLGGRRIKNQVQSEDSLKISPIKFVSEENDSFYQAYIEHTDIFSCVKNFLKDSTNKMALVIKSPNVAKMGMNDSLQSLFSNLKGRNKSRFRVIIAYNQENINGFVQEFQLNHNNYDLTFYSSFFGNEFFTINNQGEYQLTKNCFRVDTPLPSEIFNMIQYVRLKYRRALHFREADKFTKSIFSKKISGKDIIDLSQNRIDKIIEKLDNNPAWKKFNELIGLKNVKDSIKGLVTVMEFQQERIKRGIINTQKGFPLNYVFQGNPGTGKTTVGSIFGEILSEIGILESGHLVYVGRDDLVAGYVGQTGERTKEKIDEAVGGVLFIDEAYSLTNKGEKDFGHEAVEVLLKSMTEPKYEGKMAVVVAGYPKNMKQFISSNPGLKRRFEGNEIDFGDYSSEELLIIFEKEVVQQQYLISNKVSEKALAYFVSLKRDENFGNAGVALALATQTIKNQNVRIKNDEINIKELSNKELNTILVEDIPEPLLTIKNSEQDWPVNEKRPGQITDKTLQSIEDADSFAAEVLPHYDENNQDHQFIRALCDEIENILIQSISAYQGEENFEYPLGMIEDDAFKKRVKIISKYKNEINYDRFQEINTSLQAFRTFFRGLLSINQNEITNAITYFKESQELAEEVQLDELVKTNKYLIKYWEIMHSAKDDDDFTAIQAKLKDLKNDIDLSNVGEQYQQMSDLMQADLSFISAVKALTRNDINRFILGVNQATSMIEKVTDDYVANGVLPNSPSIISLNAVASFYRLLGDMIQLLYKIDQDDFELTRELSDLRIHSKEASRFFSLLDLRSNVRFTNMFYLVKGFGELAPFVQELCIVMTKYKRTGELPNKENLIQLKMLSESSKNSFNELQDDSLTYWVDMCDDLIDYVDNIDKRNVGGPSLIKNFSEVSSHVEGYAREKIVEEIDFKDKEAVKAHIPQLFLQVKPIEAVNLLEQHVLYINNVQKRQDATLLISQFKENRKKVYLQLISQESGVIAENRIKYSILEFVTEL